MPGTGLWLRVFVALLIAVLPPIVLLVGTLLLTDSVLRNVDASLVAVLVVAGAIAWGAILAVIYARSLADDLRSLLTLARRGRESDPQESGAAYDQVAAALEERNRQIRALAREAAGVPIDEAAEQVIRAVVSATRSVMSDPTWRAAVLKADHPYMLPPAIYLGLEDLGEPQPIGDLERWAAISAPENPAAKLDGPWGAFVVVDASSRHVSSVILYAPWEGRSELSPADRALLTLVGQHAATALEHSVLYARVTRQADELKRLASVQGDFLRGVTHDLQTPLTSIGALATELRADDDLPDSARTDLDTISHQADRLRRLVGQLLVASRLEAGAFTPRVEVFAIQAILERTWAALRADRPFTLEHSGDPHLAVGDPDRVEQVMWALFDNAVKYSPPESPICVAIRQGDGAIEVSVRDHGTGMDDESARRAFEQFYRSRQARKLAPDGSGVGLYAAQGLMKAMGGSIAASSTLGEGTVMTVRLPAERSGATAE